MKKETILVLDFGSQYTQLIARRIRELKVYSEIVPHDISAAQIKKASPKGLIFSGGPASVYKKNSPKCDREILELGLPILGICYGLQLITYLLGGEVASAASREYGMAKLHIKDREDLFKNIDKSIVCWMSHGDKVLKLPSGFLAIASTDNSKLAAVANSERTIFGLQFHPEVVHTERGAQILKNFAYEACGCRGAWTMGSFIEEAVENIKDAVNGEKVICGLSGGVDSSVTAALVHRAIGRQLTSIFVDNGLIRKGEADEIRDTFKKLYHLNLKIVDAKKDFLTKLKGVVEPEKKRKIIGTTFIRIFEKESRRIGGVKFLAQGTLYPDVIESRSAFGGPSATIKTHHNVGGLPKRMNLKLLEPLKNLFKDEVRVLGKELGLKDEILSRHPFPGPGLAVRILGEVTEERLSILKEVDERVIYEIKKSGFYKNVWQAFAVLLPVKSVGVMGDERTYENVVALRVVNSVDGMTADWSRLPHELLARISNRIINEVKGVNRVVYDISSKPPATIEWE